MTHKSKQLRKKEKMEVTLPTLIEHHVMSKLVKDCSKKALVGLHSNLGKFVRYLQQQGHSLKLSELSIHDARAYIASLQRTVTKFNLTIGFALIDPVECALDCF